MVSPSYDGYINGIVRAVALGGIMGRMVWGRELDAYAPYWLNCCPVCLGYIVSGHWLKRLFFGDA